MQTGRPSATKWHRRRAPQSPHVATGGRAQLTHSSGSPERARRPTCRICPQRPQGRSGYPAQAGDDPTGVATAAALSKRGSVAARACHLSVGVTDRHRARLRTDLADLRLSGIPAPTIGAHGGAPGPSTAHRPRLAAPAADLGSTDSPTRVADPAVVDDVEQRLRTAAVQTLGQDDRPGAAASQLVGEAARHVGNRRGSAGQGCRVGLEVLPKPAKLVGRAGRRGHCPSNEVELESGLERGDNLGDPLERRRPLAQQAAPGVRGQLMEAPGVRGQLMEAGGALTGLGSRHLRSRCA